MHNVLDDDDDDDDVFREKKHKSAYPRYIL